MSKKSDWVSASDIGRAAFCPKYLEHKYGGAEVDESAVMARARGEVEHDKFNEQIKSQTSDSRCFIASHVYGIQDPRTEQLRQFRDGVLMPNTLGRVFVRVYYALSPSFVALCRRNSTMDSVARRLVAWALRAVQKKEFK